MIHPSQALASLPAGLRDPLVACFNEIARNFLEHRWEPAELNGGKFSEVVYCVVDGALRGAFPPSAHKPPDFAGSCRALEGMPASPARPGDRALRVLIPPALITLYEVRNN